MITISYRIKFGCLYFPQGTYFISTLELWSTDEYVCFLSLSNSPPLNDSAIHIREAEFGAFDDWNTNCVKYGVKPT